MKCLLKNTIVPEQWAKIGRKKMSPQEFKENFPIVGYYLLSGGIIIVRECNLDSLKELRTGKRQRVTNLSPRSLSRLAILATSTPTKFKSIITPTYGANFVLDGSKVKYHLNYLLTKLKRNYGSFDYLWWLEFQARGAPHFHILTTLPAPTRIQRLKFAHLWADIVEPQNWQYERVVWADGEACYKGEYQTNQACVAVHSHKTAWEAVRHEDGARRYVIKYATKLKQKTVPRSYRNVGRFWGKAEG